MRLTAPDPAQDGAVMRYRRATGLYERNLIMQPPTAPRPRIRLSCIPRLCILPGMADHAPSEPAPECDNSGSGILTHIEVKFPVARGVSARNAILTISCMSCASIALVALVCMGIANARADAIAISVTAVFNVATLAMWASYLRTRSHVRKLYQANRRAATAVARELLYPGWLISPQMAMIELARMMTASSNRNVTMRVCPVQSASRIVPLLNPFEPCDLDEADAILNELASPIDEPGLRNAGKSQNTLTKTAATSHSAAVVSITSSTEAHSARRIKRNLWQLGQYFTFTLPLTLIVLVGIDLIFRGRISSSHWYAGAAILLLYVVAATGVFRTRVWRVIPGGVLVPRFALRRGPRTLRFSRDQCVLFVVQHLPNRWWVVVHSGSHSATTGLTRRETEFLLRAWLSPLHCPTLSKLGELA